MCELTESDCLQILSLFALGGAIGPPFRLDVAAAEAEFAPSFQLLRERIAPGMPEEGLLEFLAGWWEQWQDELAARLNQARRALKEIQELSNDGRLPEEASREAELNQRNLTRRLRHTAEHAKRLERFAGEFLGRPDECEELWSYLSRSGASAPLPRVDTGVSQAQQASALCAWLLALAPGARDGVLELIYVGPSRDEPVRLAYSKESPFLASASPRAHPDEMMARGALELLLCLAKHRAHFTVAREAFGAAVRDTWGTEKRQQQELDRVWSERSAVDGMLDAAARATAAVFEAAQVGGDDAAPEEAVTWAEQVDVAWRYLIEHFRMQPAVRDKTTQHKTVRLGWEPAAPTEDRTEQDDEPPVSTAAVGGERLSAFRDRVYEFFFGPQAQARPLTPNQYRNVDALLAEIAAPFGAVESVTAKDPKYYASALAELFRTLEEDARVCLAETRRASLKESAVRLRDLCDALASYFENYGRWYRSTSPLPFANCTGQDPCARFIEILKTLKNQNGAERVAAIERLTSILDREKKFGLVDLGFFLACDDAGMWQTGLDENDHNLGRYFCVRRNTFAQIRSRRARQERELLQAKCDHWLDRLETAIQNVSQFAADLRNALQGENAPLLGVRDALAAPAQHGQRLLGALREFLDVKPQPEAVDPENGDNEDDVTMEALALCVSLSQSNVSVATAEELCRRVQSLQTEARGPARELETALAESRTAARKAFHNIRALAAGFPVSRKGRGLAAILPKLWNPRRADRGSWSEELTDVLERLETAGANPRKEPALAE